jgi:hypothetical protein
MEQPEGLQADAELGHVAPGIISADLVGIAQPSDNRLIVKPVAQSFEHQQSGPADLVALSGGRIEDKTLGADRQMA